MLSPGSEQFLTTANQRLVACGEVLASVAEIEGGDAASAVARAVIDLRHFASDAMPLGLQSLADLADKLAAFIEAHAGGLGESTASALIFEALDLLFECVACLLAHETLEASAIDALVHRLVGAMPAAAPKAALASGRPRQAIIAEVELLFVEAGPYVIAIDSTTIGRVEPYAQTQRSVSDALMAQLLGAHGRGGGNAERALSSALDMQQRMIVDRIVGVRTITAAQLHPLPALLRHVGVPPWCLGTLWDDQQLVFLVDLDQALRHVRALEAG